MFIDQSLFPIVFVRSQVESTVTLDDQFQQLLDKGEQFVLITDHTEDDHHDESVQERKQRALFFKKIKAQMRALCRAMIVLQGDKPIPAPMRVVAATAAKAFGFAVAFAIDEDDAIKQGKAFLA